MAVQEKQDTAAGRTVPVYQILAEDIKAMGVEVVFGLMSDDTAHFGVTLDAVGIDFIGARHENTAITMGDGYAAATGRLAVVCVGRGPALANGLHGATFASRVGNPVLIIYGESALPSGAMNGQGPDYKGLDATGVLKAAGIRTFVPTSAAAARQTLADAAAAARRGTAVALLLPVNVQMAEIEIVGDDPGPAPIDAATIVKRPGKPARSQAITAAAAVLSAARKPMILAGFGAHKSGARDTLIQLAEKTGALLATTAKGKDMFRGHRLDLWHHRLVLAFRRPAHGGRGGLRAGGRRRAQHLDHELW